VLLRADRKLLCRYEADHVGMILMSCSGYDPLHATKTWHEFDAIAKRQKIVTHFQRPVLKEIAERFEKLREQGRKGNLDDIILMSMVKDGLLHNFGAESKKAAKSLDSFIYPGFVSSFPLEPSIHPYDGVFTGRLSVGIHPRNMSRPVR
jgi:hypothetical protein